MALQHDYQWCNDTDRFKDLLDAGCKVICLGIGEILYVSEKRVDDTYFIYGTAYASTRSYTAWQNVMRSELPIYLAFIDPDPIPF